MIWNCPQCGQELGELNAYCMYCKHSNGTTIYNPDPYFVREIRIYHIGVKIMDYAQMNEADAMQAIESNVNMTPQEKLHAKLFWHETMLVKDMDLLTLRAHREELAQIAFEARARLHAVDAVEEDTKRKAKANNKPTGFERSLNVDETATNAINTIKTRQTKLSKAEKIIANMVKNGIDEETARKLMNAGTLLAAAKLKDSEEAKEETAKLEKASSAFNPFAKKVSQ